LEQEPIQERFAMSCDESFHRHAKRGPSSGLSSSV
jgi:hypothetical protein